MTVVTFKAPGANEDGFVPLQSLRQVAQVFSAEEFIEAFPSPALLVVDVHAEGLEESVRGPGESPQLLTIAHHGLEGIRYLDRVAFVSKRPGNPFSLFVSLGRSASNDIVIGVESVSKVHGYFTTAAGSWYFTDRGSTNGTFLGKQRLETSARTSLKAGDHLVLGSSLTVEFLPPPDFYQRLILPLSRS